MLPPYNGMVDVDNKRNHLLLLLLLLLSIVTHLLQLLLLQLLQVPSLAPVSDRIRFQPHCEHVATWRGFKSSTCRLT